MRAPTVSLLLAISILSACTSTKAPLDATAEKAAAPSESTTTVQPGNHGKDDRAPGHRPASYRRQQREAGHGMRHHHPHDGPGPDDTYAATIAFVVFAQVFTCAFVEIILDGSCHGVIWVDIGY